MIMQKKLFPDQETGSPQEQKPEKVKIADLDIEIDKDIIDDEDQGTPEQTAPAETGQPVSDMGELPKEFVDRYKDKSSSELLKILHESQKQIGKLGNRIGEKKNSDLDNLRSQKIEMEADLKKLKQKLTDEYDEDLDKEDENYQRLEKDLKRKEARLRELANKETDLIAEEAVKKQMYIQHNKEYLAHEKANLASELGLQQIETDVWEAIEEGAQYIAGKGEKVRAEDVRAAAIKVLGAENYAKLISATAQQKLRADMANASGKAMTALRSGSGAALTLDELLNDEARAEKVLDHLYNTDRAAYEKLADAIRNRKY